MDTKYTRTTLTLPEDLVFEAKKRALAERKSLKEIITEGLSLYLLSDLKAEFIKSDINSLFGAWGKGETGSEFLKKIRYSRAEKKREEYLDKLWKKS